MKTYITAHIFAIQTRFLKSKNPILNTSHLKSLLKFYFNEFILFVALKRKEKLKIK